MWLWGGAVISRAGFRRARQVAAAAAIAAGLIAVTTGVWVWHAHRPIATGARLIARGDYPRAVRTLLPAVAAAPGDARAHYYLGVAYARIGMGQGAISHLRDAVRLEPDGARFHEELGRAYRQAGEPERALVEFEAAARLAPREPLYQVEIAGVLLVEGRLPEAIAHLREAVRLQPHAPDVRLLLATALRRAGDLAGMAEQYREVSRLAGGTALGETARQELRFADLNGWETGP